MKKVIACILLAVLVISQVGFVTGAETNAPVRIINLVYDDSGSMIQTDEGVYVDTWCQAKYAMEVFAAMLGENDTLNIYYMSDYVGGTSAAPKVTLKGSSNASVTSKNVDTIHNLVTNSSDTPFNAVRKAYADLAEVTADEKWLVVLTDGEFDTDNISVEKNLREYIAESGIKIMMLSMGAKAAAITPDPNNNLFFEKAADTVEIPGKLTGICNRIFQNNALPIDAKNLTTSFNMPMSQLIIFAQGKNVSIGNISGGGKDYKPTSNVKVQYSTVATTHPGYPLDKMVVADNLLGYVATYDTDFEAGEYSFDVKGADDIQIYYKPNVSIEAYLYEGDKEVTAEEQLVAGTYRLEFGFVNGTNGEKITDTSLLGDITYQSKILNKTLSGEELEFSAKSGDNITIKEGILNIDVTASFLEYNKVNTKLAYEVFSRNDLIFKFEEKPTYTIKNTGFTNPDDPMVLTVKISDGTETMALTPEQWELLGVPEITTRHKMGEFKIERTEEIGKYLVYPTLKDGDPMETATGDIEIVVTGLFTQGMSTAKGELKDSFRINDGIPFIERLTDWLSKYWPQLVAFLAILFLILGYVPPFKKYLPRAIKSQPYIKATGQKIGTKDFEGKGKYMRDYFSTMIPYKAETGKLTFTPGNARGGRQTASIKAAGGGKMTITNPKKFEGKTNITFDGAFVEKGVAKPLKISRSAIITTKTDEYNYKCYLSR